jgi:hypothetical protein
MRALAQWVATLGVGLVACLPASTDRDGVDPGADQGAVDLALTLAPGIDVASVSFKVEGNGIVPRSGAIDVRDPRATVSVVVGALPAGSGYHVTLTATGGPPGTTCAGTAAFSVVAGRNSAVRVDLDCGDVKAPGSTGSVTVTSNRCPTIGALTASPTTITPGGSVTLLASAFDADLADVLSFQWSSSGGGTFSDPHVANTLFRTTETGTRSVRLTVSDGHCQKSKEIAITCAGQISGGNTGGNHQP